MSRKRLVLMRHAKSDWDSDAKSDHERPLNHRGLVEAPSVGALLKSKGYVPDLVISSDARRTRETWEGIAGPLENPRVLFSSVLYLAGVQELRRVAIEQAADLANVEVLLMLGHNPGWEDAIKILCGRGVDLKTAHAAVMDSRAEDASWDQALAGTPGFQLLEVLKPAKE